MDVLKRPILRDQIKRYLEHRIVEGKISQDDKLSLADLSRDLSVSVTPIREALSQMAESGILRVIPNRGFFLPKVSIKTAKNLYPIIGTLESLAIEQSHRLEDLYSHLSTLNEKILKADNGYQAVKYDFKFHATLVANCANKELLDILSNLKLRVINYEILYMREVSLLKQSTQMHNRLLDLIKSGDQNKLALLVKDHWNSSLEFIDQFLDE